jgi:hypothetical protein
MIEYGSKWDTAYVLAGPPNEHIELPNICGKTERIEVFTAVIMKNVVFWDIRTQFVLHRRHITYPLQSPPG